jgi:hypothetical protein
MENTLVILVLHIINFTIEIQVEFLPIFSTSKKLAVKSYLNHLQA